MVRSPSPTPALQLILGSRADKASPYSYLCSVIDKAGLKHDEGVEVSPLALGLVQEISRAVSDGGGAALLIDYGEDFTAADSLRGFHKHKVVNVLSQPGEVDVTADVDFSAAAKVALQNDAWVAPLLTQGEFLMRMGIAERLSALIDLPQTSEEQAEQLFDAFTMLVAPEHMGTKFKALAISNKSLQGKLVGFADSTPSSIVD